MLLSSEYKIVLYFVVLYAPESDADTRSKYAANATIEDFQVKFSKLLASIAQVNEKKLNEYNVAREILRQDDGQKDDRVIAIVLSNDKNVKPINSSLEYRSPTSKSEKALGVRSGQKKRDSYNLDSTNIKPKLRTNIKNGFRDGEEKNLTKENTKLETNLTNENIKKVAESNDNGIEELQLTMGDTNINSTDVLRHKCRHKKLGKKALKKCKKACKSAYKTVCNTYMCSSRLKRDFGKACKSKCRDKFDD